MTQNTYAHCPAMTLHEAAMLKAEEKCHPIKDGIFECKVNRTYALPNRLSLPCPLHIFHMYDTQKGCREGRMALRGILKGSALKPDFQGQSP